MPEKLIELVVLLGTAGFFGSFTSWLADNWAWFRGLGPGSKVAFLLAMAFLLSVVSYVGQAVVPGSVYDKLQPFYAILGPMIAQVLGQWVFHQKVNKPREDSKAVMG